jgi:hypothetical protein
MRLNAKMLSHSKQIQLFPPSAGPWYVIGVLKAAFISPRIYSAAAKNVQFKEGFVRQREHSVHLRTTVIRLHVGPNGATIIVIGSKWLQRVKAHYWHSLLNICAAEQTGHATLTVWGNDIIYMITNSCSVLFKCSFHLGSLNRLTR